ncbi:MAG: DUF2087 domain-containing protein [Actinobacteria bacterium]|nr:DUF2087 domain-containing protein [Actinomycetota bacterium]
MDRAELFWNASIDDLKRGYIEKEGHLICLMCNREIDKNIVYPEDGMLYNARGYMKLHIVKSHGSVFEYLLAMDKKLTGLSEHQKNLLAAFYKGKSDDEIKHELDIGSISTIRNHRFAFREKERQSKLFVVLMELLKQKDKNAPAIIDMHRTATMVDERYNITADEMKVALKKYFPDGNDGRLLRFPKKQKHKLMTLRNIAARFESNRTYKEKEVNEILKTADDDYVTLRRYLIEYGFLDRKPDGSQYWLK